MKENQVLKILTIFRIESQSSSRPRYRIVHGHHHCDDSDCLTYWIEEYLPNTRVWTPVYRSIRYESFNELMTSSWTYSLFNV